MLSIADVKRMAIGAGLDYNDLRVKQLAKAAYDLGCQQEREACAKVCESLWDYPENGMSTEEECYGDECAKAIRERGNQ